MGIIMLLYCNDCNDIDVIRIILYRLVIRLAVTK